MFNPSDLEGEVDHSFFDSDCDDSSVGRGDGKKIGKDKQSKPGHEWLHAKQTKDTKGAWSPRTDGTQKHLKPVKNNSSSRAERKENSCHSGEEERHRESSISVSCTSDKVVNNSSDGEEDFDLHSKMSKGTFMALSAGAREADDKDVYSQSPNESEEEILSSNAKHSKGRNKQTPKKRIRSRYNRSPSPTSTEASMDADSESSCSSSNRRSSLDSANLPRPNKSSLSPGGSRIPVGSARTRDVPASHKEESDDTITDVSPLSSPDSSLLQSLDLNRTEAEEGSLKEQQQEESVPSSGLGTLHQDEDSDPDEDEYSLSSVSQLGGKLVFHGSEGRNRKNYSFTNEEVRSIDHENQRLLRALSRLSPGPRPGSKAGKKAHMTSNSPLNRLSHSALNRQREQQRIERENLAFLKRLESVKPTPGLKRAEQLADYQRQVGYQGAPSYPVCVSSTKKGRSVSKTHSEIEISLCCPHQQVPGQSALHTTARLPPPVTRPANPFPGPKNWVQPDQPGAENTAVLKKHVAGSL
ncbi:cilia- and flagella-associated protein 97 isoform X3 [Acanthopagrus latus]|uniref:cilia- and flagella-associated protein 97 isoform X3 n=1 Tax=Acanthopagrus latus TaxID=8177 RepID=UPI00187CEBA1|nr:cilia- and flagella-associated protein 97 isoform X3 [Acanthopagrus latus]